MPALGCFTVLAWLLGACAAPLRGPEAAPALQVSRTVDLSHVIREDSPTPPGDTAPRLFRDPTGELLHLRLGANTGSLVRVVAAAGAELDTVERLSPRDLVLPAVLIDARAQAQDTPGFALSAEDVRAWERVHGPIAPGTLVLLATGWDLRWGDPGAYLALARDQVPRVPGFGADAADLLLNQRGAAGLGVDAPGRRYTPARGFALLLENLTSLEQVPPSGATVVIGALKLQAAHAAPARVLALVP
ncbi:MAG: cyclase family protein [Chloroflexi bacterium]|nr:cyclase family protein [Chloroflexota bacterium]